jgi:DNA ligase (NAD+)
MEVAFNLEKIKKNITEWAIGSNLSVIYKLINDASDQYYNSDNSILDDDEFDKLVEIYNMRSPKKYEKIGAQITDKNKCKLPVHMGSMNKTKSINELKKWIVKQNELYNVNSFIVTPKIDGTSALILVQLIDTNINIEIYTRGDGDIGKKLDSLNEVLISSKSKEIIGSYMSSNNINKMVFRGEMIVSKSNFTSFSKEFKCPRSMVNGITNKKDNLNQPALKNLDFALFEIIEPKMTPEEQFKLAHNLELNYVQWQKIEFDKFILELQTNNNILESLPGKILTNYRKEYKYDIDGIIISSNILYELPKEGNPSYSLAFKINQKGELTKVKEVEWNVSKHGVLKPRLIFDKIRLGSSDVERCTGFNGAYIFNNSIGVGSVIRVVLSGEIIPYVTEILEQAPCPSMPTCGYKWNDTKIDCVLLEDNDNLKKKKILTFIKTIEIDYLADGIVNHLYKNGYKSLKSILTISKEELIQLDRIEDKMANKLVESINDKIGQPLKLDKVMDGSLCFGNGFGLKRCTQITTKFPNFIEEEPSYENLIELSGWSDKSILKFKDGLDKFKEFLTENDFIKFEKGLKESIVKNTSSCLFKQVCITGKRDKDIVSFLQKHGIELVNSITKDVELLICDDVNSSSSKLVSAKKKGVSVIDINLFKTSYMFE